MEPLTPLAAFQGLALAFAVAIVIDARKEPTPWRYIWFATALFLAFCGLFANWIGQKWPVTYNAMFTLGASPETWFVAIVALYFILRPLWKSIPSAFVEDGPAQSGIFGVGDDLKNVRQDVQRISSRLDDTDRTLKETTNHLRSIENLVVGVEQQIPRINKYVTIVEGQERSRLIEHLKNNLKAASAPMPTGPRLSAMGGPRFSQHSIPLTEAQKAFQKLGGDMKKLTELSNAAVDSVKRNSKYYVVTDDEKNIWTNGDEKQQWYTLKAQCDILARLFKELVNGR